MDRNELVEKALGAVLDKPSRTTPGLMQYASHVEDDVEDARQVVKQVLDAILPDVIVEERLIDVGEYEFAVGIKHRGVRRFRKEQRMVTPWVAVLGDALKGGKDV